MSRARELTMGDRSRRNRPPAFVAELKAFTAAREPDLDLFRDLLDRVASSRRPLTGRQVQAWVAARRRFHELTGQPTPGPSSPYLPGITAPVDRPGEDPDRG